MSTPENIRAAIAYIDEDCRRGLLPTYSELAAALSAMWAFASTMVEQHGVDGDNTMTDEQHAVWQDAAGDANNVLNRIPV